MTPLIYLVIAFLSWIVAFAWYLADPGFEPLLAFLTGVASLLQFIREREDRGTRLRDVFTGGGDFIGRDKVVKGDEVHGDKVIILQPDQFTPRQRRIREGLITRVRIVWVEGILEHGIHQVARLELGLELRPDAVPRPRVQEYEKPGKPEASVQELSPGTTVHDVWQQTDGSLLILGAPGSGKTFTLVELAEKLLDEAEQDETRPVPLIFNLSSWAQEKGALLDWLITEMHRLYGVGLEYSPGWLAEMAYALFLDGLDEVSVGNREACIAAIHAFQADYGRVPLAVCSRSQEYEDVTQPLKVEGVVHIRPLSEEHVDVYLVAGGEKLAAARVAVKTDALLRQLAKTPLMLNIISLAYWNRPVSDLTSGTLAERRKKLFDAYVARMFERQAEMSAEEQAQSRRGLSYLARQMAAHEQLIFYLQRLDVDWLPGRWPLLYPFLAVSRIVLAFGLAFGLLIALDNELIFALFIGLAMGIGGGLVSAKPVDKLTFVRKRATRELVSDTRPKLAVGLVAGLVIGLVEGVVTGLIGGLAFGLFFSLIYAIEKAIVVEEIQSYATLNQGFTLSSRNAIRAGLGFGLIYGLAGLFGGLFGLFGGSRFTPVFGLGFGSGYGFLTYGGGALLKHVLIRVILPLSGRLPLRLVTFLEEMRRHALLRRVGGGYMFIHRMLQEYFVELDMEIE